MKSGLLNNFQEHYLFAEQIANRVSEICAAIPVTVISDCDGAMFSSVTGGGVALLVRPVLLRRANPETLLLYERFALEKPRRVALHNQTGSLHIASAQSRDVEKEHYAGGLRHPVCYFGVSGFNEALDCAVLIYALYYERAINYEQLQSYFEAHGELRNKVVAEFKRIESWHTQVLNSGFAIE